VFVKAYAPRSHARLRHALSALAGAGVALSVASVASADVSSWLFVGTGPALVRQDEPDHDPRWSLQLETGIGTPPQDSVIFGGLGRTQTIFGRGTDLALLMRTASHGFVNGDWGGAIDVGPYRRFWGSGSTGVAGSLVLGAPWGLALNLGGSLGSHDGQSFSATLGVDFARLTVYRRAGQNLWVNPFPPTSSE
jgi:hypothetical protein